MPSANGKGKPENIIGMGARSFLEHAFAAEDWIVRGLLPPSGRMLIWGGTGAGKSCLAFTLLQSLIQGKPFLKRFPVRRKRAAYLLTTDMPPQESQKRVSLLLSTTPEITDHNLWIEQVVLAEPDITKVSENEPFLERLRAFKPDVLFVDLVSETHRLNSIEDGTPSRVYAAWKAHMQDPNLAFVFVHQERKTSPVGAAPDEQSYSGNHNWLALAHSGLRIRKVGHDFKLQFAKYREKTLDEVPLHMDGNTMLFGLGHDHWGRAWDLLERGLSPGDAAAGLVGKSNQMPLAQARQLVDQVVEVWGICQKLESD